MKKRLLRTLAVLAAIVLASVLLVPNADAHMGAERFKLEKRVSVPPKGPRGQIEIRSLSGEREVRLLRGEGTDYTGAFEIRNTGPGPLTVNRVYAVDADDDPRSPPGLGAQPEGGVRSAIAPGEARRWTVTWHAAEARAQELYVLLVVDSDAAKPDAKVVDPPKLVGVVAQRHVGLLRHGLLVLSLLPLAVAAAALASRFVKRLEGRVLGLVATVAMVAETALALFLAAGLDRELGRRDGNDGLQWIDRFVLDRASGVELFFGVDGLSMGAIVAIAVVGLACAVAAGSASRREIGGAALAVSGAISALSVQTTLLFVLFWAVTSLGVVVATRDAAPRASSKIAIVGALSTALLGFAMRWLASHAGGATLFDGTDSAMSYAFADLARAHFASDLSPWLGLPGYRAAWLLSFLGAAAFLPLVPLHSWLGDLGLSLPSGRVNPAPLALAASVLPTLSGYAVLRLTVLAEPDGARWGAESLPVVGVALLALGAIGSLVERRLDRVGAHLLLARAGLFLVLTFSLTPHGIEGAAALVPACAVASALFYLTTATAVLRLRTAELARVAGLGRSAPLLSAGLVVGAIALASPILPGLGGPLVGLVGAMGRNPISTIFAVLGLTATAFGVARSARVVFGARPASWTNSKYLEPFGGSLPDLRRRDLGWASPLLGLALALAVAPRLFVAPIDPIIRDLTPRLDPDGPTRVSRVDAAPHVDRGARDA